MEKPDSTSYDPLTGLPEYSSFLLSARKLLPNFESGTRLGLSITRISNYRYINLHFGDEIIKQILLDFKTSILSDNPDILLSARVYEGILLCLLRLDHNISTKDCKNTITRLNQSFMKKYAVQKQLHVSLHTGFYIFDYNGQRIEQIVSNANLAMETAEQKQLICHAYDEKLDLQNLKEMDIIHRFPEALKNDEFQVFLQPKISAKTMKIAEAEALVRWFPKDGAVIYPNDFIGVLEESGNIGTLDFHLYEKVFSYLYQRMEQDLPVVPISLNVSRRQLDNPDKFLRKIQALFEKYPIPPSFIELELTESLSMQDYDTAYKFMISLKNMHLKISMDDFGSGYSSISTLANLPIDILKLDKALLDEAEYFPKKRIIISTILDMAKSMELNTVCEGVETELQVDFLKEAGCDYLQGFYFSRPVDMETFNQLLEQDCA